MRKAFTLVELMIAVTVMVMALGYGIVNYRASGYRQAVIQSRNQLVSALEEARANANAGKKDCTACGSHSQSCGDGDSSFRGWEVLLQNVSGVVAYTIRGVCGDVDYGPIVPGLIRFYSKSKNLAPGVSVTSNTGGYAYLFRPANGGFFPESGVVLTLADTHGNSAQITINGAGEIQ